MKMPLAALLAVAMAVPALTYAQTETPASSGLLHDGPLHQSKVIYAVTQHMHEPGSGVSPRQDAWLTQPSEQALGQSLYKHR
ncbi:MULTISPECIES: hypothetical protein [unclassified Caballeronia]|uniref:hypothetical protein n=1 Tax=unclassified Caballeronia TaxID=2646786 RepID=UPI00285DBEF2|nr:MULTISPECIES: hypothetical protein [unclassified Caballeronia]MDR5816621.1 hypothetical protein [Caballeronia sp. LZ033]MDR5823292.1 hypothetical protein [Caballeronia sp. LZ043]MDR5881420.1 hypothetical protein [Caballeronia sp. LZ032]